MSSRHQNIYLDHSATTPLDSRVQSVIEDCFASNFGNASSIHSYGRTAKVILEESRETVATALGAENSELFFTSGGTESDNQALIGVALAHRRISKKNHIIVSSIEHHAVLDCCEYLKEEGFIVSYVPVSSHGVIDVPALEKMITPKTCLISVMHANNETGIIQPLREVSEIGKKHGIAVHSDAVQTFGKIDVNVHDLNVDLLSVSAHKTYGPKGIGALFIRKGTEIDALLHGGSQERNNRAGTENVPLIAGFAKAVSLSESERPKNYDHVSKLWNHLHETITGSLEGIVVNSDMKRGLSYIFSISLDSRFYEVETETLLLNMDMLGVAVSSGSACTSGSIQPSHVLTAMGRDKKTTQATIRFSFGKGNTMREVKKAGELFCSVAQRFRRA